MRQAEVQSRFLERFGALYPQLTFRGMRSFPHSAYGPYAFVLRVAFGRSGVELDMLCAALTDTHPKNLKRFIQRIQETQVPQSETHAMPVLVAPHFAEEARTVCRQAGIGYFDLAGNGHLDGPRVFLEVTGKANTHVRERRVRTPFEGKAERIVRTLLLQPEDHWNMRGLAKSSGVSLGLTSMTTSALASMGMVVKSHAGLDLFAPAELLEAWSQSYDLRRSPFRIYRSPAQVPEIETRLADQREALSGRWALTLWPGAHHVLALENRLPRVALYFSGRPEQLAQALGLSKRKGQTPVFVFQPYDESLLWGATETRDHLYVVHPLQLYLDLCSGDKEELELAESVRSRLLPW